MTTRTGAKREIQVSSLFFLFVFLLVGAAIVFTRPAYAAQSDQRSIGAGGSAGTSSPVTTSQTIRVAQVIRRSTQAPGNFSIGRTNSVTGGGRVTNPGPSGGGKGTNTNTGNSGGGDRGNRGGGGVSVPGAVGIGIGIIGTINAIDNANRATPPRVRPAKPPKKTITRRPPRKKIQTARRPPPPPPAPPPVPLRAPRVTLASVPQFIADEVVVLIGQNQPASVDDEVAQALGLTKLTSTPIALLEGRLVRYRIQESQQLSQVIAALAADPRVDVAQPNNYYTAVGQKKRASPASAQYALGKLALAPAHKIAQGRGVNVAVIDTGVDISHPELSKAVAKSFDAVDDGEADVQNHGTAIAGLIAGQGKVTGVAPAAALLSARAFYTHPQFNRPVTSSAILLRAFDWAFTNGARVFNMSFAGPFDPLVKTALENAHARGTILVAAAGNGGPKAPPAYPAAYEQVIAITALDHQDRLYAHANRGNYLTAAAPGVDVLVPALKKSYSYSSGTSMAAAHISGLVALLLERHPQATAEAVVNAIKSGAHDLGPKGHDAEFGAGRADAHASLMTLSGNQVARQH